MEIGERKYSMAEPKTLLEKWKAHPSRRAEFAAILREPVMQDALAIVREQTFSPRPLGPPAPYLLEWSALLGRTREGYLEMLANFLSLANVSPFTTQERKAWANPDLDRAKEALRQEMRVGFDIPAPPPVVPTTPGDATPLVSPNPQTP